VQQGRTAGRFFKQIAKQMGVRKIRVVILSFLSSTAPVWGPVVLALILALTAYMILFGIPLSAAIDKLDQIKKTQAFLGTIGDEDFVVDPSLLDKYKIIANTWDEELTDDQKTQVQAYKFPYTLLMSVDRVVNDNATWEGKQYVEPQPQKVFEILRPRFYWKDSTITTVTTTTETDEEGNTYVTTNTSVQNVVLLTKAETYEGIFINEYEWETIISGNITITREILKDTITPEIYYLPLKDYLRDERGIKDEQTFEVVQQLAIAYSTEEELQIFDTTIDLANLKEYPPGNANVPYYNQTDKRWGALSYGRVGTLASSGCGPTSLAMIISGLTKQSITPDIVAKWSVKNGYRIEGNGSAWSLMTDGGAHWGLKAEPISRKDPESIVEALSNGYPVMACMDKGHFTNGGHFIVLRGITENGKVLVYDSISVSRSAQPWELELILRESSKNGGINGSPFWSFRISEEDSP
jgi:hypothetical protein